MFKKGDKVKCINRINDDNDISNIKIGCIYTIGCEREESWVVLEEKTGVWSSSQFELAEAYKKEIKIYGIVKFCQANYK